jgi:GNAT superfamily N-acetyltransferase
MDKNTSIEIIEDDSNQDQVRKLIPIIKKQLYKDDYDKNDKEIEYAVRNALRKEARSIFFIYQINNEIIGFAFGNVGSGLESGGDYFWINELYIEEKSRNQGIASKILLFIEEWAKENKIKHIACITGNKNIKAQGLYKKNKYEVSSVVWIDKEL